MEIRAGGLANSRLLFSPPFSQLSSRHCLFLSLNSWRMTKPWGWVARPGAAKGSRSHASCGTRMCAVELEASLQMKKKAAEVSNELKGTSIFLVGMNCTIKTNLGKLLADVMRYCFFDSDSIVEQAMADDSNSKNFGERKDDDFRQSETEVLKQLSSMGRLVVCAGDGAVQSLTNLASLRHGISVWVDVPLDMLAKEVLKPEVSPTDLQATSDVDPLLNVIDGLSVRYNDFKEGYGTADATVSLQEVASQLGYVDLKMVTQEDMVLQTLKEIERLTRLKKMMEEAGRPF